MRQDEVPNKTESPRKRKKEQTAKEQDGTRGMFELRNGQCSTSEVQCLSVGRTCGGGRRNVLPPPPG